MLDGPGGRLMPWPASWDRGGVIGALEEASGVALSVQDALPDTLIAHAQELGLHPLQLFLWISEPEHAWTVDELTEWAERCRL
jgi:hypothetical protein